MSVAHGDADPGGNPISPGGRMDEWMKPVTDSGITMSEPYAAGHMLPSIFTQMDMSFNGDPNGAALAFQSLCVIMACRSNISSLHQASQCRQEIFIPQSK